MNTFIYEFDELELIPGASLLASGFAVLEYNEEPADPSVGYRGGLSWRIKKITLDPYVKDGPYTVIDENNRLYPLFADALYVGKESNRIAEEINTYLIEDELHGNGDD